MNSNCMSRSIKTKPSILGEIIIVAVIAMIGYHSLAFQVWQWRNPKTNSMTFYTRYLDVVTLKKLPEFQ